MSTSTALGVPLHFASSSAASTTGPVVPQDWRQKWHRSNYRPTRDSKASTSKDEDFDENWPDEDLQRWVTCIASWEDDTATESESSPNLRSNTFNVSVADENGQSVNVDSISGQDVGKTSGRTLGGVKGGLRIALGTQNGCIWLFREKREKKMVLSPPAEISSRPRSPSRNSIASDTIRSPLIGRHTPSSHGHDLDALSSPTQAVASMSDVTASGSSTRNTNAVDVEERLETQFNAGRESHSVVGGVMEVLGFNHSNQHLNHSHPHSHVNSHTGSENHSGTSTPHSQQQLRRKVKSARKDSVSSISSMATSQGSPTVSVRPRTVSTATTTADQYESNGERNRLSHLMGSSMQRKPSRASPDVSEVHEAPQIISQEQSRDVIEEVETIAILQGPSAAPLVFLTKIEGDRLASLQEDGSLIIWSLQDATQLYSIDIKTAKSNLFEEVNAIAVTTSTSTSSPNLPSSPSLPAFAAARSNTASPIPRTASPAPRSRSNSNAAQPNRAVLDSLALSGISRLHSMRLVQGHSSMVPHPLLLCFDDVKCKATIFDATSGTALATQILPDCSSMPLQGRFTGEGDCVEIIYVNGKNSIVTQFSRIATARPSIIPVEHTKHGPLTFATSAFLRREGISNANSRAVSIAEEKSDHQDLGNCGIKSSMRGLEVIDEKTILVWTDEAIHLLRRVADSLILADSKPVDFICSLIVEGQSIVIETEADLLIYRVEGGSSLKQQSCSRLSHENTQALSISDGRPIFCRMDADDNRLQLECSGRTIWKGQAPDDQSPVVTASLPFSMERVVISLSSGHLVMCSLADLVAGRMPVPSSSSPQHKGTVTMLRLVINPRTQVKHIVGGTEEGDIIFWDAATLRKQSERSLLSCPVSGMLVLGKDDNTLRLNGCLACVGADGSLVTFLLDGLNDLYTIPGRGVALEELAVRADELLLIYEDARARVWDMRTLELRRSIGLDQAKALLDDGKGWWTRFSMGSIQMRSEHGSAGVLASIPSSRDATAGTMMANFRKAIEAASRMVAPLSSVVLSSATIRQDEIDETADIPVVLEAPKRITSVSINSVSGKKALHTLRPLMHCLMPLGLDADADEYAAKLLQIDKPLPTTPWIQSGTASSTGHLVFAAASKSSRELLSLSPATTTMRLLSLTSMLLVVRNIGELQDVAFELLTMLGVLPSLVGESFQPPCLALLSDYISDSVNEIRQAAQTLFTARLEVMSQEALDVLCDHWIDQLPSRGGQIGVKTSKAVLLLGLVAVEKYLMLPPTLLKEVANSISLFLHDDTEPTYQSIAILLCDRGFTIFQHYFDAMDIVRTLFALSTSKSQDNKEDASPIAIENRGLARRATLRISEDNTPLFMTTLSMDILHAQSPAHCDATMKLVALMVRKKPLILHPNLPRLAEAVVKSLDPTITSMRTVIHRSATIIISELVATYSTIAFHKELQRLAVGTFEGAIIMYDLKTSTRLYVIEAHHSSLSGLSFSPDGRRLISICLADNKVKVWKTGVGFGSFLSFGGAPRQGNLLSVAPSSNAAAMTASSNGAKADSNGTAAITNGGRTSAYKVFEFARLVEGDPAREADDLKLISFEWTGPRNVRVQVGETRLSFDAR